MITKRISGFRPRERLWLWLVAWLQMFDGLVSVLTLCSVSSDSSYRMLRRFLHWDMKRKAEEA